MTKPRKLLSPPELVNLVGPSIHCALHDAGIKISYRSPTGCGQIYLENGGRILINARRTCAPIFIYEAYAKCIQGCRGGCEYGPPTLKVRVDPYDLEEAMSKIISFYTPEADMKALFAAYTS